LFVCLLAPGRRRLTARHDYFSVPQCDILWESYKSNGKDYTYIWMHSTNRARRFANTFVSLLSERKVLRNHDF
jgi:hypothetical protein